MGERKRAKRKSAATGEPVTKTKIEQALIIIRAGDTLTLAAHAIGCSPVTLHRIFKEEYADQYTAAKEARALALADKGRALAWNLAMEGNSKALGFVLPAYVPEFKDAQKVELSGEVEVTHPDIAAAIESFTERVVSLATRGRTGIAGSLAAGPGESEARVPVAELDRAAEPGGTTG